VKDLFDEEKGFWRGRLPDKLFNPDTIEFLLPSHEWDGDKVLTHTIQFAGQTYTAGTRVHPEARAEIPQSGL